MIAHEGLLFTLGAKSCAKGQKHQRVLQALGLVHGDDLHQAGITLQSQGTVFIFLVGCTQNLGVVVHQGMFAVQLQAVLLQQFGNVQNVGQPPFAVRALQ